MELIDFHTHILPGIDDGSANVDEALAMLHMEAEQGIRTVIATPHFYPQYDSPDRFLQMREKACRQLCDKSSELAGLPQIILGAEVYFFRGMSQSDRLDQLTIGEKKCILIEMPASAWTDEMYRELARIRLQRGIIPVIAHVERYLNPFTANAVLRRLEEAGAMVQANTEFFLKRRTTGAAMGLLHADRIHLLGSDCHNMGSRSPNMDAAVERIRKKLGDDGIRRIEMHQQSILNF